MNRLASIVLVLLSVLLFLLSLAGNHGLLHLKRLEGEAQSLQEKDSQLSREIAETNNQIYGAKNSDDVLEQRAREELGLAKPNEVVYIFPETNRGRPEGK